MADYLLVGVGDDKWRWFKASCDLQGVTIRQFFIDCIDNSLETFRAELDYHKPDRDKPKKGGKKT